MGRLDATLLIKDNHFILKGIKVSRYPQVLKFRRAISMFREVEYSF